ncbi:hypothetical protein TNCV_2769731 [Trichonephila clavipes]|nr:hypothetical protein TNCV_2769731 [Trichonephila clavipes]
MIMREHFGQQLHNTLFSVGVEVNNLGGLQAVDNDSKLRHKRDEIREMVFDQKQEVAFDWLDPDEKEVENGFGWAMKENRVEPLCTQYKERVQQNSVGQWVGKEGWGSGYSCHNEG